MNPHMSLHFTGKAGYIGRLSIPETARESLVDANGPKAKQKPQVFFILDRSGSMGQWVGRMVTTVIPLIAEQNLGMSPEDELTLITFDEYAEKIITTVKGLQGLNMRARGCTHMEGVFSRLLESVNVTSNPSIVIVAISDGEVQDQAQTLARAHEAAVMLKGCCSISASAIRLMTSSYSQPDTRALASVLQLNTDNPGSIIDLPATDASHLKNIVGTLGSSDTFVAGQMAKLSLKTDNHCIRQNPWSIATSEVQFNLPNQSSSITFWVDEIPSNLTLNGASINIQIGEPATAETLGFILGDKLKYFMSHLRVLRVINSEKSKQELDRIVSYFKALEDNLPPSEDIAPLLADGTLKGRLQYTKAYVTRQLKSVSIAMQTLANDGKVEKLNLAQQADYLRQTGSSQSRTTRNFAKRAITCGLDFDSVMHAEVLSMLAHADELNDIDDTEHAVSFYSQATTLDGIKCMLLLANEPNILRQLSAPQLIRLFNIVGIPCNGPTGDFPDPMTYRVTKFLPGSYISIADVTTAWNQGGAVTAPGYMEEITNAIPFFEDCKIQSFLQKYARSTLEYVSSLGMRRMIAEVPKTYPYTICAGLWKMVEELDKNGKTELAIKHFVQLTQTYELSTTGLFDHIIHLLEEEQDPELSYNLGHNGITNMLGSILALVRTHQTQNLDRILRALYSFETYQVMRRLFRDDGLEGRVKALDKILGVDFSSDNATPLPALFARTKPKHCSEASLDLDSLKKYTEALWFVHYVTLVPQLFDATVNATGDDDCVNRIKMIPKMSDSSISVALGLPPNISLDDFMLYTLVEGVLYSTKQERVNKDTNKPLLKDLGRCNAGSNMIAKYVHSRYAKDYETRLQQQLGEEKSILRAELIDNLIQSVDMDTFVSLLAAGNSRGVVSITIDRENCAGFERLHEELLDDSKSVPKRVEKLRVIYTGKTRSGVDAFNGGNMLRTNWKPFEELLVRLGEQDELKCLREEQKNRGHMYRGGAEVKNRHGHSNDLPSYFGFGCISLKDYYYMVSAETWELYVQEHSNCCGVAKFCYTKSFY